VQTGSIGLYDGDSANLSSLEGRAERESATRASLDGAMVLDMLCMSPALGFGFLAGFGGGVSGVLEGLSALCLCALGFCVFVCFGFGFQYRAERPLSCSGLDKQKQVYLLYEPGRSPACVRVRKPEATGNHQPTHHHVPGFRSGPTGVPGQPAVFERACAPAWPFGTRSLV
jgi:hypothetical protein